MEHYLAINSKTKISYRLVKGKSIGIIFLNGFMGNKNNVRCLSVEEYCKTANINFVCFDYYGHGASSGDPYKVTIGSCIEATVSVLDHITQGPQVLVASSAGGWIMNLVAKIRPARIAGMIGCASAPDFTKYLMWDTFSADIKEILLSGKAWETPEFPIPITYKFIEEAKQHCILNKKLNFNFPIILLHGKADLRVPYKYSEKLANCYDVDKVSLKLIADATHSFNRPTDLLEITNSIDTLYSLLT